MYDRMMDYQIYMDIFEDDDKNYKCIQNNHISDYSQEDITGLYEIVGKSNEDILHILIIRKNYLDNYYEKFVMYIQHCFGIKDENCALF